jgi:hypothetical protein
MIIAADETVKSKVSSPRCENGWSVASARRLILLSVVSNLIRVNSQFAELGRQPIGAATLLAVATLPFFGADLLLPGKSV